MKIKEVCNQTNLTDRAIRLYISKGLVSPEYTENYNGRKSFEFSKNDVKRFSEISILRKAGFSIDDIYNIIYHKENSSAIISRLTEQKKNDLNSAQSVLKALENTDRKKEYTVSEIAELLKNETSIENTPQKDNKRKISDVLLWIRDNFYKLTIFLFSGGLIIYYLYNLNSMYRYIKIDSNGILSAIICFTILIAPFAATLILLIRNRYKIKKRFNIIVFISKGVLTAAFLFVYFIAFIISHVYVPYYSQTDDFNNYLKFDNDTVVDNNISILRLFPIYPPVSGISDTEYYYRYTKGFDYQYDVFAEWTLNDREFDSAIKSFKEEFSNYEVYEQGNYICYSLADSFYEYEYPIETHYTFSIFAYNENTNTVRYIYCHNQDEPNSQPYIFELEWE